MMIIRPITRDDLPALVALAKSTGVGLTTLPPNEAELSKRVDATVASFDGTAAKADEIFLFVLEDTDTRRVVGTCGLATAVGLRQPWYSYRVGLVVHASQELGLFTQTPTLFLSNDHTGHTELCSLFLDADYRRDRNGQLLSKSRFLFLAQHRERFSKKIIAELRGVSDDHGKSPFWESLGRHFFSMEFSQADYLTGIGKKSFVAELMPKHPLYSSFLTPEAQAVIGKTHPHTVPALRMLESEGFRYEGYVDIFDAGPTVECDVADVGAVASSRIYRVAIADSATANAPHYLVSTTGIAGYRATLLQANPAADQFPLSSQAAAGLGVKAGDEVRAVALAVGDRH
jgi:arginine N-succinyltransferase